MSGLAEKLLGVVALAFSDPRVATLCGLILLDVLLAVAAAIKQGKFEWRKLGEFYQTMVVPYVIGYLALWIAAWMIPSEWLGPYKDLIAEGTTWMAWLMLVGNLIADVIKSGKALGYAWEAT